MSDAFSVSAKPRKRFGNLPGIRRILLKSDQDVQGIASRMEKILAEPMAFYQFNRAAVTLTSIQGWLLTQITLLSLGAADRRLMKNGGSYRIDAQWLYDGVFDERCAYNINLFLRAIDDLSRIAFEIPSDWTGSSVYRHRYMPFDYYSISTLKKDVDYSGESWQVYSGDDVSNIELPDYLDVRPNPVFLYYVLNRKDLYRKNVIAERRSIRRSELRYA